MEKKRDFNLENRNVSIWQNKGFEIRKDNYLLEVETPHYEL